MNDIYENINEKFNSKEKIIYVLKDNNNELKIICLKAIDQLCKDCIIIFIILAYNIIKIRDSGIIQYILPLLDDDNDTIKTLSIIFISYISFDSKSLEILFKNNCIEKIINIIQNEDNNDRILYIIIILYQFSVESIYKEYMRKLNIIPIIENIVETTDNVEIEKQAEELLNILYSVSIFTFY